MRKISVILFFLLLMGLTDAKAIQSQTMGGELIVTHVSGSQYKLQINYWRFIIGLPAPHAFQVHVRSLSSNFFAPNIVLTKDSFSVISPNYAEEHYYSALFTFPNITDRYEISTFFCCRSPLIINLFGPSSANNLLAFSTEFTPSISGVPNSSPRFYLPPEPIVLANQPYVHGPFAYDLEGDSLTFRLDTPQTNGNGYVPVNLINASPFWSLSALPIANSIFSFDTMTGTTNWLTTSTGGFQHLYKVDEWRNGQKIGSVTRDFRINVLGSSFNPTPPSIFLGGNQLTGIALPQLNAYAGSVFNLTIAINDPDPSTKSFRFTGPIFQGSNPAMVTTTNTSNGISASINWTPGTSMVSSTPHMLHIRYLETTPLYTFSRDIPVMVTVLPAVAGLGNNREKENNLVAFLNEDGRLNLTLNLDEKAEMRVVAFDVQGRNLGVLMEGQYAEGQHQFISDKLAAHQGLIILRAEDGKGWQKTLKLIKP